MFEVQDLKYATLATVSRCGMVWFSEDVLSTDMIFNNFLARLRSIPLDEGEDEAQRRRKGKEDEGEEAASPMLQVCTVHSNISVSSCPRVLTHTHAHTRLEPQVLRFHLGMATTHLWKPGAREVCLTPASKEAQPPQPLRSRLAGKRETLCCLPSC